jgi:NADH-quinone oxidoreductase subunit F
LLDICDNISGKSFCPLGDAATSSITSGIKLFREEFEYHVKHGHCMVGPGRTGYAHPDIESVQGASLHAGAR